MTAPDRRTADRRISPAIGQFAICECARLRAVNAELVRALQSALSAAEFEKHPSRPWHDEARAAIAKAKGVA